MVPVLVDSNVILDVATDDLEWGEWSASALERVAQDSVIVINPVIYAEVSIGFTSIEDVEDALPSDIYVRAPLPYEAAFLAGKCYQMYRRRGGPKLSPLPDFYIGAHAAVLGLRLLTRDRGRYKTYFPKVDIIAP